MNQPGTDFESVGACVQAELGAGSWPVPAGRESCPNQELDLAVPSAMPAPVSAAGRQGPLGTAVPKA